MITLPILRDLALRLPSLDRFVAFPGFPGIAEQFFEARKVTAFFQKMQAEQFDLAVQMQGSGVYSNPFTLLLGARVTAGFVRAGDSAGRLAAALPLPCQGHEVQRLLALTTFLGAPPQGVDTEFPLQAEDHAAAEELLAHTPRPLMGLHPWARDATRRWALTRFVAVGKQLRQRYGGTVVILGEPEEWAKGEMIARELGQPCLNLVGKTTLMVLGAVLARLSVFVTNDTGPAHIAYALGVPTVTIFGSASPEAYAPLKAGPYRILIHEVPCRPCGYATCPRGYTCLEGVTVEQAITAVEEIIGSS